MRTRTTLFVAALAAAPAVLLARSVTLPNLFSNGTVADANDVNANFAELAAGIDDNDARLDGLEAGSINGVQVGEPGALPVLVAGSSPSPVSGYAGSVMFPLVFDTAPVIAMTPRVPDDSGATRCRITAHGRSQLGWSCWSYTSAQSAEAVDWLAVEAGMHTIPTVNSGSAVLQAGIFNSSSPACSTCTVTFPQAFAQAPVVLVTVDESYDNSGPTSAYLTNVTATGFTVATSHGGSLVVADRIHWVALLPTGTNGLSWGSRTLYAGKATETAQAGNASFGLTLPKTPASVVLTPQGAGGTSVRHSQTSATNTNFYRSIYTDTAGASGSTMHWVAWVDR